MSLAYKRHDQFSAFSGKELLRKLLYQTGKTIILERMILDCSHFLVSRVILRPHACLYVFWLHAESAEIIGHTRSVKLAELKSFVHLTCRFCFCRYCRWHCLNSQFCCVGKEDVSASLLNHSSDGKADMNDLYGEKVR